MAAPQPQHLERVAALYPELAALAADEDLQALLAQAPLLQASAGAVLFDEGSPCAGFPLVLEGGVRVAKGSPQGRSIELYRVTPGEMCVVSTTALFGHSPLAAHGQAFAASELVLLPPATFDRLARHESFRRFVFATFSDRLADLMSLAEAVAFQRLDQRLAAALLGRGNTITITHQALADELGTVREIVTRLLKRFEAAGWLALGRERIELVDSGALRELAAGRTAV